MQSKKLLHILVNKGSKLLPVNKSQDDPCFAVFKMNIYWLALVIQSFGEIYLITKTEFLQLC